VCRAPDDDEPRMVKKSESGEVICPTGKKIVACENLSTRRSENIPLRVYPKSNLQFPTSRPTRGAYRDRHGRWAWDAMDAAVSGAIIARDE
jgi:hypothetical protein